MKKFSEYYDEAGRNIERSKRRVPSARVTRKHKNKVNYERRNKFGEDYSE